VIAATSMLKIDYIESDGNYVSIHRASRCAAAERHYARIAAMELNQIKRFIKDLEERADSLRRYL
jgi:hypothetical protein